MSPTKLLSVGVVGATGMVGTEFIRLLETRKFPVEELRVFASQDSKGVKLSFRGSTLEVQELTLGCFKGLDVVFFSSGDEISKEWAPIAVREGAFAIDNSAAFRMNPEVLLCVPEVNGNKIPSSKKPSLIANPNCSTIQLVVVLKPIREAFGLDDVRVASYQSVSGAGKPGVDELRQSTAAVMNNQKVEAKIFPHQIAFNNIPQIGKFDENGFCAEEMKIINETRKILDEPRLRISAFTVRTPTLNGHSEAVWVTTKKPANRSELMSVFRQAPGIIVQDEPTNNIYPMAITTSGLDPVYIGRIHQDLQDQRTWMMWVVADNIRKGAATNGLQIAEQIFDLSRVS